MAGPNEQQRIIDLTSHVLDQEMETFEREKERLLARADGKYVLIKGDEVLGVFDDQLEASNQGFRTLGHVPFLIKRIEREERVETVLSGLINL